MAETSELTSRITARRSFSGSERICWNFLQSQSGVQQEDEAVGYGDLNITITIYGVGITFGLQQEMLTADSPNAPDGLVRPYAGLAVGTPGASATVSPNQSEEGVYVGVAGFFIVGGQAGVSFTDEGVGVFIEGGYGTPGFNGSVIYVFPPSEVLREIGRDYLRDSPR